MMDADKVCKMYSTADFIYYLLYGGSLTIHTFYGLCLKLHTFTAQLKQTFGNDAQWNWASWLSFILKMEDKQDRR